MSAPDAGAGVPLAARLDSDASEALEALARAGVAEAEALEAVLADVIAGEAGTAEVIALLDSLPAPDVDEETARQDAAYAAELFRGL